MKVLLYGEYSGVHGNLMSGLASLGCQVDLITSGDGFKAFKGTVSLRPRRGGFVNKVIADFSNITPLIRTIKNYDIVQFINPRPGVVTHYGLVEPTLIKLILLNSKRAFYYVCGCDSRTYEVFNNKQEFFKDLCAGCIKDYSSNGCSHVTKFASGIDNWFLEQIQGIISSTNGAYSDIYHKHEKFLGKIPFPIHLNEEAVAGNAVGRRSFSHGVNRYYSKGSDRISAYLQELKRRNRVEYEIFQGLPIDLYKKKVIEHRFLIDQMYGDSIGMNSLLGAALGRIVLTRFDESIYIGTPFFNINPSFDNFKQVIFNVNNLSEKEMNDITLRGYDYILNNHRSENVAQQFISMWLK